MWGRLNYHTNSHTNYHTITLQLSHCEGEAHQPDVLIDHETNECIEVETITVKDVKHRPKGEAEADDVKPGASHQLSQPSAESGRNSTSRRRTHSDKHYNIEVDAEWYEQQVEGKPPLLNS